MASGPRPGSEQGVEGVSKLGYPVYPTTLLGVAYAGLAFDLIGATASHAFVGDPISESLRPIFVLALCAASYHLRPTSRQLAAGAADSAGAPA